MTIEYGAAHPSDDATIASVLSYAFGHSEELAKVWLARHEHENVRVIRRDGRAIACAMLIRMGQFFGGRRVPMVGVAGVATAPEARGSGVATKLMTSLIAELHDEGVPISTLYPATQPLYRRAGYEVAGAQFDISLDPDQLRGMTRSGLALRPYEPADCERLHECYRSVACHRHGYLDRTHLMWDRIENPRGEAALGFVVEQEGALVGYAFMKRDATAPPGACRESRFTDVLSTTPEAACRLLEFMADHASLVRRVAFNGLPNDPLLLAIPEPRAEVRLSSHWMVRVTDAHAALEARGYGPSVAGTLGIEIEDDICGGQSLTLAVRDGVAQVDLTSRDGGVRTDARGFAALYTGFVSARSLRSMGRLAGSDDAVNVADAIFGGPLACMPEMF